MRGGRAFLKVSFVTLSKRGCAAIAIGVVIGLAALLYLPYQHETITGVVSKNETRCDIEVTNNSGWTTRPAVERVRYPLDVFVFVTGCAGVSNGQPFSAELISAGSGKVIAQGLGCADAPKKGDPCLLEAPPIASLKDSDRYIVRVVRAKGDAASDAELRLGSSFTWRSLAFDALMSV
jgi:hypothetical protein